MKPANPSKVVITPRPPVKKGNGNQSADPDQPLQPTEAPETVPETPETPEAQPEAEAGPEKK